MPKSKLSMPEMTHEQRLPSLVVREFADKHATLTLSRPEVHNALDAPLVDSLQTAFSSLRSTCRTVLLEGEGASFCAGADLRGWDEKAEQAPLRAESLAKLLHTMRACRPIVVAKVHGVAAAGGAGLAAACDIVLAANTARFRFPETRLGLVPAVISPYVERALGPARTRYLFLTAAFLSADEAYRAGWLQQSVKEDELELAAIETLHALWRAGPNALAESKWLLDALVGVSAAERDERCQQTLERVRKSDEAHEGIRSFFARDTPSWVTP